MRLRTAAGSFFIACSLMGTAVADERYLEFIEALQQNGYHDLVAEYIEQIKQRPNLPDSVKALSNYAVGKSLLVGAELLTDLKKRDEQLQQARGYFEKFVEEQPQHARTAEAQMDLSQILVERGRVAILHAENPNNQAKRAEFQKEARGFFDGARQSFADAATRFEVEFKKFPPFIPETDKRARESKRDAHLSMMQAQLRTGLVEYEYAQTYERGSPDYKKTLEQAVAIFENVYSRYRSWLVGLYARMWEGKCFEEMGELGKAEGFYRELLEHEDRDSALLQLQRQVQFFKIIVLNKRGDHVLAADLAQQWVREFAPFRRTEAGLGVQFELAQSLLQQGLAKPEKGGERNRLLSQAMTAMEEVTRYETIYKQPAIVLQQKYKGLIGATGAVVTFDRALALAEAAKDGKNWAEAGKYYALALKFAKENIDVDQLAYLRYVLAYCHLQTQQYYEAAVLGEYVTRRHSKSSVAASAGNVAMAAFTGAYNETQTKLKQTSEFEEARLLALAEHLIKTWPTSTEANGARLMMAELHMTHQRYEAAAQAFEGVTSDSPDYARVLGRAGDAYWKGYVEGALKPAEQRDPDKLARWLKLAQENLSKGVAEQLKTLKPEAPLPLELAEAQVNLAEVSLESGQAPDAVKLVNELTPKIAAQKELQTLELRALIALLRGYVVTDNLQAAQDTMQAIEKTGRDLAQITRVYLDLGKQLQAEIERIKARNDEAALKRLRDSYIAFLKQMAARKEGQTFATLQWTGESFFGLEMYPDAADRFKEVISRSNAEAGFLDKSQPQNVGALTQVKLRLVTALRKQSEYIEAWELIKPLAKESNPADDPLHKPVVMNYEIIMERGWVLQEWAETDPTKLKTVIDHWGFWGQRMEPMAQKPPQYFEIRLNLIRCLLSKSRKVQIANERQETLRQAERQFSFVTNTSDQLGGPKLKEQYKQVQKELEKELGRRLGAAESKPPTEKPVARKAGS